MTEGTPPDSITIYVVAAALLHISGSMNYLHVCCIFPICCSHLIRLHSRNADYMEGMNLKSVWCLGDVQCITGHCSKIIEDKQTRTENRQHSTPLSLLLDTSLRKLFVSYSSFQATNSECSK